MSDSKRPDLRDITSRKARAMGVSTDIDIDFADREAALAGLPYIPATQIANGQRMKHKTGVYFQNVPTDPLDGLAVFDYKEAGDHGYFKLDFLNVSIYREVRDEAHLVALLNREPVWELFDDRDVVDSLAHLSGHFDVVSAIRPRSIEDIAVCLALIRPGKRHLLHRPRHVIDAEIWKPSAEGYTFKRSHAIAYATSIVVQLNLLVEKAQAA